MPRTYQAVELEVELDGRRIRVEPVSVKKANAAFAIIRRLEAIAPKLTAAHGRFVTEYGRENFAELNRVEARLRYPSRPLIGPDGGFLREPAELENPAHDEDPENEPAFVPNPRAGEVMVQPSPIDTVSETDWAAVDGILRMPKYPSEWEVIAALAPVALELAEEETYRLLALFTMSNEEVSQARRADGGILAELDRRADLLGDLMLEDVFELAVVAAEVIDGQLRRRLEDLGGRAGKLLGLLGVPANKIAKWTGQTTEEATTPSTGEPSSEPSDGGERSTSSSPSSTPTSSTSSPPFTEEGSSTPPASSSSTSTSSPRSTDELGDQPMPGGPMDRPTGRALEPTA